MAALTELLLGLQEQGEDAVVDERGVVVHPQVVVVVARHGLVQGAPHAAVPVQVAVAAEQPDVGMALRHRLGRAVGAGVVQDEHVEGAARHLLGAQGVQARQRQGPAVVDRHDGGDTNAGHPLSLCRAGRRGALARRRSV